MTIAPIGCNIKLVMNMNPIAEFIRENRKAAGLTQEEFALRSGLGLRFVRELEQGKPICSEWKLYREERMIRRERISQRTSIGARTARGIVVRDRRRIFFYL